VDLATGRGQGKLTSFELVQESKKQDKLESYEDARDQLERAKLVNVPKLKENLDYDKIQIMKLKIDHQVDPVKVTEPMAFCGKVALSFMDVTGEKCVPACQKDNDSDEEGSDEEDSGFSSLGERTLRPDTSDVPKFIAIVTPPSTPPSQRERSDSAGTWDL
jgi:hypothetical protein